MISYLTCCIGNCLLAHLKSKIGKQPKHSGTTDEVIPPSFGTARLLPLVAAQQTLPGWPTVSCWRAFGQHVLLALRAAVCNLQEPMSSQYTVPPLLLVAAIRQPHRQQAGSFFTACCKRLAGILTSRHSGRSRLTHSSCIRGITWMRLQPSMPALISVQR